MKHFRVPGFAGEFWELTRRTIASSSVVTPMTVYRNIRTGHPAEA